MIGTKTYNAMEQAFDFEIESEEQSNIDKSAKIDYIAHSAVQL